MRVTDETPTPAGHVKRLFSEIMAMQLSNGNRAVVISRGVDFYCDEVMMCAALYKHAHIRKLRVVTSRRGQAPGEILVKIFKLDGGELIPLVVHTDMENGE